MSVDNDFPNGQSSNPGPGQWEKRWVRQVAHWKRERGGPFRDPNKRAFWDGFDLWESYEGYTRYPGKLMTFILGSIDDQQTVLDIGAGSGALAIPMAQRAARVTAVEPSLAQCGRLRRRAASLGIHNLAVVESNWEDFGEDFAEDFGEDVVKDAGTKPAGSYDIITAGYCLFMENISGALKKMRFLAGKKLFLIHSGGDDLTQAIGKVLGRETAFPDLNMLLSLLHEMGWEFQCQVFRRDFQLPLHLQLKMFRYTLGVMDADMESVKEHLEKSGRVFAGQGDLWVRRRSNDALVSVDLSI